MSHSPELITLADEKRAAQNTPMVQSVIDDFTDKLDKNVTNVRGIDNEPVCYKKIHRDKVIRRSPFL